MHGSLPPETVVPAVSWGKAATEAMKHPWRSGLFEFGLVAANVVGTVVYPNPITIGLALGLGYTGTHDMRWFLRDLRSPRGVAPLSWGEPPMH